jgi:death-on-curing protein
MAILRTLTLSELIFINSRVVGLPDLATGKRKVRDIDLLEAAAQRPLASAFGADAYPELADKIAALFHSLVRNHPFADGNKRTATVAALFMAEVNGQRLAWDADEALGVIVGAAETRADVPELAAWFAAVMRPCEPALDPDAARDAGAIDRLTFEHRWLLDELATR